MPNIIQPTNIETFIDPYSSQLFDMGVQDSRVYLSRQVNSILRAFGSDVVLAGLDTDIITSSSPAILSIQVTPGKAIVDSTLHIFNSPVTLSIDTTPYDKSGFYTVSISYQYIQTLQNNSPYIKLEYISADGQIQLPDPWSPNRDRLVIACYQYINNRFIKVNGTLLISNTYYDVRLGSYNPSLGPTNYDNLSFDLTSYNLNYYLDGGTFFDSQDEYLLVLDGGVF